MVDERSSRALQFNMVFDTVFDTVFDVHLEATSNVQYVVCAL